LDHQAPSAAVGTVLVEIDTAPAVVGNEPVVVGTASAVVGTALVEIDTAPAVVGNEPVVVGTAPAIVGTAPAAVGTAPTVVGTAPTVVGTALAVFSVTLVVVGTALAVVGTEPARLVITPPLALWCGTYLYTPTVVPSVTTNTARLRLFVLSGRPRTAPAPG